MKTLLLALLLVTQSPVSPALQVGTITGRLFNEDGSPAVKIFVSARSLPQSRDERESVIAFTETDSTGRYRLTDVPIGRYYIVADFPDSTTYFPRVAGPAGATPVNVTANSSVADIDFRIEKPSAGLTVSGKVIQESNPSARSIQVNLSGTGNADYINRNVTVKSDGSFEFMPVPAGTYTISVRPAPFGEAKAVIVSDEDVKGLELRLPWTGNVTGKVLVEGGGPVPTFPVLFAGGDRPISLEYPGTGQTFGATLPEGFFVFTAPSIPSGFYLKSVTSGGIDLLSNPLRISRTEPASEIVVTLGVLFPSPWVRLSGHLRGSMHSTTTIYLSGPGGNLTTTVAADGSFEFPKILPGRYSVAITPRSPAAQTMTLVVPNRDVAGVEIALPGVKEVTGRIIVEDGGPIPSFTFMITPGSGNTSRANISTSLPGVPQLFVTTSNSVQPIQPDVQKDGTFRASFPEGPYLVRVNLVAGLGPAPYSVKSFTYGSTDLLKEPLAVRSTDSFEIQLTLSPTLLNSWVKVSGRVIGLPQMPEDIMPQVSLHNSALRTSLWTPVRQDGSFDFPRVYSGRYTALLNGVVPNMDFALSEIVAPVEVHVRTSDITGVEFVVPRGK